MSGNIKYELQSFTEEQKIQKQNMANLTYSVYMHTKTISLDKTFTYNVLKKGGETEKIYKFI